MTCAASTGGGGGGNTMADPAIGGPGREAGEGPIVPLGSKKSPKFSLTRCLKAHKQVQ